MTLKKCTKCKKLKPPDLFFARRGSRDGKMSWCKTCKTKSIYLWRKKKGFGWHRKYTIPWAERKRRNQKSVSPEMISLIKRKSRYGITKNQIDFILCKQNGCCAICLTGFVNGRFHVDHDHDANYVRGFLCKNCNQGLGFFKDSVTILTRASVYLESSIPLLGVPDES